MWLPVPFHQRVKLSGKKARLATRQQMSSHSQGMRGVWGSVQYRFSHRGTVVSLAARMGVRTTLSLELILSTLNSHLPHVLSQGKPQGLSLRSRESPWSHTYLSFTSFPCWWIWFSIVKLMVAPCTCSPTNTFILDLYSSSWKYRIISGNHTVRP